MGLYLLFFILYSSLFISPVSAQKIGGNVYGGGNKGNVNGKTTVTVKSGDIDRVFGGARMSNVGERTYVYINGKNRDNTENPTQNTNTGNILINQVYGGNDIAGTIGTSAEKPFDMAVDSLNTTDPDEPESSVYATYNTFVHIDSEETHAETGEGTSKNSSDAVYIGSLYAGGNGDYYYKNVADNDHRIYFSEADYKNHPDNYIAKNTTGFQRPELDKTYLEIDGGSIVYAFGGGNNATIRKNTVIHVDNPSDVVNEIYVDGKAQLTSERIAKMGINPGFTYPTSASYQIGSLFGGNNQATMAIRPTWDLQSGLIRNVYSGGNKGAMTSPVGLLLDVNPTVTNPRKPLEINNIYGGCRMADVHPLNPADGSDMASTYIDITDKDENGLRKYNFPVGFAARLLIRSGKIDNVYGGNDIQGKVWGGNAVGIRTSINGNIYGGGNGAYPYTDNSTLATNPVWSDLYYNPGSNSVEALTAIRPHAEQVSIHITGTQEKPTIIRGNVFCGGNCATLKNDKPEEARVELKLGSYVTAENVFLGNNGAHMVNKEVLKYYKGYVKDKEVSLTKDATNFPYDFSTIDLTEPEQMSKYMDAVAMNLKPKILVDNRQKGDVADYEDYSSWIGSFYCGGNVGSMTYAGPLNMKLNEAINVYEKVVGGCNNANVPVYYANEGNTNPLNARYEGGIMGSPDERVENGYTDTDGNIKDRLIIDCDKVQIKPKRWNILRDANYQPLLDEKGKVQYVLDNKGNPQLEWNTVTWEDTYTPVTSGTTLTSGHTYYTKKTGTTDEYEAYTATGTEQVTENKYYEYAGGYTETGTGEGTGEATTADLSRRLKGGNLYGGCYNSGHVNGNVVINQLNNIIDRQLVFAQVQEDDDRPLYDHDANFKYHITQRNSGVILDEQGMDEMASALSIFGGGYGKDSEIWGSTTINIKRGYSFQIYGGGEQGVIGKSTGITTEPDGTYDSSTGKYAFNKKCYDYNDKYSTTINLFGEHAGTTRAEDNTIYIAESEFLYAGGFEGPVIGDTHIYLGNGRIFDAFAGGCNADILGHSEAYVGRAWNYYKEPQGYDDGFPYIRDYVYGGSDLGGKILGSLNIKDKFHADDLTYRSLDNMKASTYVEYLQGIAPGIYGGCYGAYDYDDPKYAHVIHKPYIHNSVVNFRPKDDTSYSSKSSVRRVFGAGEGASGQRYGDAMQEHSYVHVHIPEGMENFTSTEVFGAGNYYGVGMSHYVDPNTDPTTPAGMETLEEASAIIDLVSGEIAAAYGGSYNEGVTRRTEVNVPAGSTIKIGKIFGGSYGTNALPPCDVYESNVNFASEDALVTGAIYGGNNNVRRTLYSKVNISSPVWSNKEKGYLGTVYGAGYGTFTWSEYTEVNLLQNAKVYEVYGGGQLGQVLNAESIQAYMMGFKNVTNIDQLPDHIKRLYSADDIKNWDKMWKDAWTLGTFKNDNVNNSPPTTYYTPSAEFNNYVDNAATNLSNPLTREAEIDDREPYNANTNPNGPKQPRKYNTNVIIHEGAYVGNYAYGGGLGDAAQPNSGDVLGSTYAALLGGTVNKDIYAGGTTGNVYNIYGGQFTASANAYIKGGTVRNVYGGGWRGGVGFHKGYYNDNTGITNTTPDVEGESHIVIGDLNGTTYLNGIPAITRNVYGGGEGGGIVGNSNVTINNGFIGFRYKGTDPSTFNLIDYKEELDDKEEGDNLLDRGGNVFGGGYVANSFVDHSNLTMYGGIVRGSLYGGGEIGPIGRGTMSYTNAFALSKGGIFNQGASIFKAGTSNVTLYDGSVLRNVFGGGRGYDNWGGNGYMTDEEKETMDLSAKGYVFGQTRVNIFGGEVGTEEGMKEEKETGVSVGNVFGGGDVGYVFSAYEQNGHLYYGNKSGKRYDDGEEGYYYRYSGTGYLNADGTALTGTEKIKTEDCKVLVEPHCKVATACTINSHSYAVGSFVPTSDLQYLGTDKTQSPWTNFEKNATNQEGIIIHNAVFAGGNTITGSSIVSANTTTVFGNATASIHDVYHRDLITIGTGHTGGLYGDGNLTRIDGYRELNITNYGTDYYSITPEITNTEYENLKVNSLREAAYYEIRYKCKTECTDKNQKSYRVGSTISHEEFLAVFEGVKVTVNGTQVNMIQTDGTPQPSYWEENGVMSRYAGRIMNTIQRADFCGVFGSRMVMQGAQDRVPETVDYTNYTINRVREVSLNKKESVIASDKTIGESSKEYYQKRVHGNYFGIYNTVNYLGALTSDVDFYNARRTTDNSDTETYQADIKINNGGTETTIAYGDNNATFAKWKEGFSNDRRRNNGNSYNKVALASGVHLELTTEKSTGPGLNEKDWGLITGVVELDLINVQQGVGGGFVYAKNVHGVLQPTGKTQHILSDLNQGAITNKKWTYIETGGTTNSNQEEWQTSGNFVHSTQTIIDDCYNISGRYEWGTGEGGSGKGRVPAHYWYIRGAVYVYDQYISAYTGSSNAYSEIANIPLTITAASRGKMTLLNVQPNYYAYYKVNKGNTQTKLSPTDEMVMRDVTYKLNDPIDWWTYNSLSAEEKALFVPETYVNCVAVCIDNENDNGEPVIYPAGTYVMNAADFATFNGNDHTYTNAAGNTIKDDDDEPAGTDYIFRNSNNASHDTGFILTYNVTNPKQWDTWYTQKVSDKEVDGDITTYTATKINIDEYNKNTTVKTNYWDGPTYTPKTSGLYGQQHYDVGNIINEEVYNTYDALTKDATKSQYIPTSGQATFERAYIVTDEELETTTINETPQQLNNGATIAKSNYTPAEWNRIYNYNQGATDPYANSSVQPAYICTSTIALSQTEFIYIGTRLSETEREAYHDRFATSNPTLAADIYKYTEPAYYCTSDGLYGGDYYEKGYNYRGLNWSGLSDDDRDLFDYNYDALDLFIDKNYSGTERYKYQYDGPDATIDDANNNPAHYSLETPLDYTATFKGTSLTYTYKEEEKTIHENDEISRDEYESLFNERYHYSPINVKKDGGDVYVVNTSFVRGETPYAAGQVIEYDIYKDLGSDQSNVTKLTFQTSDLDKDEQGNPIATTFYYCRENYTIDSQKGHPVTSYKGVGAGTTYTSSTEGGVPVGIVIKQQGTGTEGDVGTYKSLTNDQTNFVIHGLAPSETSTLYVSGNTDIYDLSQEKIITVVYEYNYDESDMEGMHITPVTERHVLNIHLQFKSGVPIVEDIQQPEIVIPGTTISIKEPYVTKGAYEITGGGWELFRDIHDAESNSNGIEYLPTTNPLYLYQDKYYLKYYAKSYLGKSYSNAVQVLVANSHDIKKVMGATEHHYYIDHKTLEEKGIEPKIYINNYTTNDPTTTMNGLDLLKSLYDLSLLNKNKVSVDQNGLIDKIKDGSGNPTSTDSPFKGHALLNERVKGAQRLEFFLRTDIDHSKKLITAATTTEDAVYADDPWTPIASGENEPCFEGTLHGDGHTISGLKPATGTTGSLFGNLCGDVYNLGVTGSFTGAGIVDKGKGYVENCWINTTGTPDGTVYAVFGNPTADGSAKQIVNCYYQEGKNYKTTPVSGHGMATAMPDKDFYNGEVAYNLNGFYLYKRYNDGVNTASGAEYKYWKPGETTPQTGKYSSNADNAAYCSSGYVDKNSKYILYVEDRFADGDFIYADGTIPTNTDERLYIDEEENIHYYPIWPDDYLYFGQSLSYGYVDNRSHQDLPSYIWRSGGRLVDAETSNRVYRAPAYFRNGKMDVAHFNPYAVFAPHKKGDASVTAYKDMTAIDFSGGNGDLAGGYQLAWNGTDIKHFYQPLLDDDGLTNFRNEGLTKNLLVYTDNAVSPSTTESGITANKIKDIVIDPTYTETNSNYKTVAYQQFATLDGHWVQKKAEATNNIWYESVNDHLLADKNDFNAPIAYEFQNTKRMWHQRTPANYVNRTSGWEAISLPFTADMVTTDTKGEITHFYNGSEKSKNSESKIGHEYWLRELDATKDLTLNTGATETLTANFQYPYAKSSDKDKDVSNTFLWDYYYEAAAGHNRKDANKDTYQEYYKNPRSYPTYARLTGGTPYIIGFPGVIYYEFDLSGQFEARTTYSQPERVKQQVITFVSPEGTTVRVSDQELKEMEKTVKYGNAEYIFKPSYLNERLTPYPAAPTEGNAYDVNFALNEAGNNFALVNGTAQNIDAFRPFFTGKKTAAANTREYNYIDFENVTDGTMEPDEDVLGREKGILEIFVRGRNIHTISHLKENVNIRIINAAGATLTTYTLEPGKTVVTPVTAPGTYIVNKKKVFIK